jgi:hypothetical protein
MTRRYVSWVVGAMVLAILVVALVYALGGDGNGGGGPGY